jgi:hypothetical protein
VQGSLEIPLGGDPKAEPWEQWEALEYKNKPARLNPPKGVRPACLALALRRLPKRTSYIGFNRIRIWLSALGGIQLGELIFVPHGFPFFQAIQPSQFLEYLHNLRNLRPKSLRALIA